MITFLSNTGHSAYYYTTETAKDTGGTVKQQDSTTSSWQNRSYAVAAYVEQGNVMR